LFLLAEARDSFSLLVVVVVVVVAETRALLLLLLLRVQGSISTTGVGYM
jgi:hypothetical protein